MKAMAGSLAGNDVSRALDFTGGSMAPRREALANFQIIYGGTNKLALSGGSSAYFNEQRARWRPSNCPSPFSTSSRSE